MKKFFCLLGLVMLCSFSAIPARALVLGGLDTTANRAGYVEKDVIKLGGNALNLVLSFVGVLFLLIMMVGGFMWMTAGGQATKVSVAQKLLVTGTIGLIIVISAYVITAFVGDSFSLGLTAPTP